MEVESAPPPNWLELPRDVTAAILSRVDDFDVVRSAQFVCTSWRSVARDPLLWQTIDMRDLGQYDRRLEFLTACLRAVDYSSGSLESVIIHGFASNDLLLYVARRSKKLKCLRLCNCEDITDEGLCAAVAKLPLLEELELTSRSLSIPCIDFVGRYCPRLKSFTFRRSRIENKFVIGTITSDWLLGADAIPIAIVSQMPGIRNLDIADENLTDDGVEIILEGCPHLETLDLHCCSNVRMDGDLHTRCKEKLKHFRPPCNLPSANWLLNLFPERYDTKFYVQHESDDEDQSHDGESSESNRDEFSDSQGNESDGESSESNRDEFSDPQGNESDGESSESNRDEFSDSQGNESEELSASDDDDFSDVSDDEVSDVSFDDLSEGEEDLTIESSGPEQ